MPQLYGLDEEEIDKLTRPAIEMMKGMRAMSMRLGVGKESESIYSETSGTMRVDDSARFMVGYTKYMKAFSTAVQDGNGKTKGLIKLKSQEIEIDGRPALQFEMAIPMVGMGATGPAPTGTAAAEFEKMMERMVGPGGKTMIYIAAADDQTIVYAYTSKDELRRCLEAVRNPKASLSADPGVAKTDALLPDGALWVGYWSPSGTVAFTRRMMSMFDRAAEEGFKLPDFPETPPIGFAAKLASGELQTDMVVPSSVLEAAGRYFIEIQKMKVNAKQPAVEPHTHDAEPHTHTHDAEPHTHPEGP